MYKRSNQFVINLLRHSKSLQSFRLHSWALAVQEVTLCQSQIHGKPITLTRSGRQNRPVSDHSPLIGFPSITRHESRKLIREVSSIPCQSQENGQIGKWDYHWGLQFWSQSIMFNLKTVFQASPETSTIRNLSYDMSKWRLSNLFKR